MGNNTGTRAALLIGNLVFGTKEKIREMRGKFMGEKTAEAGKIYHFTVDTIDGQKKALSDYAGQALLIVNVASLCGYTPQYEGLEKLYRQFSSQGFKILAFPANEFGKQEPGSNQEIAHFCRTKYSVSFDLFAKIKVKGEGIHPLYEFLTTESGHNGEIPWNFTKFLVDRKGNIVSRFGPQVDPLSKELLEKIESVL